MKSLIGLVSYYRSYINHLADHIKPLTEMIKRNKPVLLHPTESDIAVFDFVKYLLITALVEPGYKIRHRFVHC